MTKRFFRIAEAVTYSGLSRSSLYAANKSGQLAFVKFGGATRIELKDLDAYLDSAGVRVEAA